MTTTYQSVIDEDERLCGLVNRVEIDESHPGQLGSLLRVHPLDLEQKTTRKQTVIKNVNNRVRQERRRKGSCLQH
jgi:hypothetical protein